MGSGQETTLINASSISGRTGRIKSFVETSDQTADSCRQSEQNPVVYEEIYMAGPSLRADISLVLTLTNNSEILGSGLISILQRGQPGVFSGALRRPPTNNWPYRLAS